MLQLEAMEMKEEPAENTVLCKPSSQLLLVYPTD